VSWPKLESFLPNVARQKLLKSANVSWSYSKNKSGTFFMDYSVWTWPSIGLQTLL